MHARLPGLRAEKPFRTDVCNSVALVVSAYANDMKTLRSQLECGKHPGQG